MAILHLLLFGVFLTICVSQPYSPADYQSIIEHGFTTIWFKGYPPFRKYHPKNIDDIYAKGFRNVRIRCRADLKEYKAPYNDTTFESFLDDLSSVVDKCLDVGVTPIISWIHHHAEAYASEKDRQNYVSWWTAVANKMKNKDYRLGFNLFTELGTDVCGSKKNCTESLRKRIDKYTQWTSDVVHAIRETGGNNAKRILILSSPGKTADYLDKIDKTIYENDGFMMAEWHLYASGPNKKVGRPKYWSGNGDTIGKENVRNAIKPAKAFTDATGILTYLAEWMPHDNKEPGDLNEAEVINFARYFAGEMKKENIPWSLNVLDRYYNTKKSQWLTGIQDVRGQPMNMSKVLDNIIETM